MAIEVALESARAESFVMAVRSSPGSNSTTYYLTGTPLRL
jgi:hypothetical protein